ncbi:MAG: proline dehydrogenase family protein [Planctomycetota bacterium]|nr:proline dehydrogenase family protein [Planctomycetota bacterium]
MTHPTLDPGQVDREVLALGERLHQEMAGQTPGVFNRAYWEGRLMEWAMRDPAFKIDLLRFVDALPALESTEQMASHVREYLLKEGRDVPAILNFALKAASGGITAGIATRTMRANVTGMAEKFIVGTQAAEAIPQLKALWKEGMAFTVDLLGEATTSDAEGEAYKDRYLDLIDNLPREVAKWPADELLERNSRGPIPRANVSVKVSAMDPYLDPADPKGSVGRLERRVLPLFLRAKANGACLNLDLEQWAIHHITLDLFERLVTRPELRDWPHAGIVVQAYLRESEQDVERLLELAKRRRTPIAVRLVKGAYWDYEVTRAAQGGLPCPVFTEKAATDAQYERLSVRLLENADWLQPAFASHNLRSLAHAMVAADQMRLPPAALEIQMLYGMAEPERRALRAMGRRVRLYTPVGQLLPGMGYLVRRLLENTANEGFLRLSHHENVDIHALMQRPRPQKDFVCRLEPVPPPTGLGEPFRNASQLHFEDPAVTAAFGQAVAKMRSTFPTQVPVVVGGRERHSGAMLKRECPSDTSLQVAEVAMATDDEADAAVEAAYAAWPAWRDTALEDRARLLDRLADRLTADRVELAALQCWEVAKPWREADADVAEAIDFCRYYARQAVLELAPRRQGSVPGEDNVLWYEGRGPCAVISPWNFPLAILCGMSTAALVAGNPVLIKPSSQSAAIAYGLYRRMMEVGFPPGVVQFLPGSGRVVGARLVEHPKVAQIAFTGSREVGLGIIAAAARTPPGAPQVKRVVCEMGGKNAVVIDDDADLDEAVLGVIRSAFGYAGQKCSACSRAIVVGSAYEPFLKRLVGACASLPIGPAHDPSTLLPPVVDKSAYDRLTGVIADPGQGAKALFVGKAPFGGYFVPPALFEVSDVNHRLMQEEFFGPVVALMKAATFDQAMELANRTEFALTGAVFSRAPSHLEQARKAFRVGNLYLNRGCTGAMVDRQPFGGFRMSGIGTKAGGPNYLLFFADPRSVTENTMRRGVVPELTT